MEHYGLEVLEWPNNPYTCDPFREQEPKISIHGSQKNKENEDGMQDDTPLPCK